ncbi:3563_t:CDS:2 [Gigaspora margarita]|uniref:3563_t:CDS:1 n=1 Tax=Gigaspora margarita TaxID=4874 RepID=A0ABN7VXZ0_GIGMA|nr:3563_t:CDS:2 [Gigaspora margarita]
MDFINDALSTKQPTANKQHVTENWAPIVSKNFKLPTIRFSGSNHYPEWRNDHAACAWCWWEAKNGNQKINEKNLPQNINTKC